MKKLFTLTFSLCLAFSVSASEKASTASVEKLLELTETSTMMDATYDQITSMFEGMSKQMGISEKERPAFNGYMKKVSTLLKQEMGWDKLKEPMVEIYINRFTEEEIQGLIAFYQSDIGQTFVKKMPLVMQDSTAMSQQLLQDFMPKIKALAAEMQKDIAARREQAGE